MKKIFLFLIVLVACISLVNAFGIYSPYKEDNPLRIAPGETTNVSIGLQNMPPVGNDSITLRAEITNGTEIATLTDASNEYTVPLGSYGGVNIKVTIPSTDPIGKTYTVSVSLTTITPGQSGSVAIGQSVENSFPVIVSTRANEQGTTEKAFPLWVLIVVIVIVIAIIIWLLSKAKKSK